MIVGASLVCIGPITLLLSAWLVRRTNKTQYPYSWLFLSIGTLGGCVWWYLVRDAIGQNYPRLLEGTINIMRRLIRQTSTDYGQSSVVALFWSVLALWCLTLPLAPLGALLQKLWQELWEMIEGPQTLTAQIEQYQRDEATATDSEAKKAISAAKREPPAHEGEIRLGYAKQSKVLPRDGSIIKRNNWYCLSDKEPDPVLNEHLFVLGTTGFGKTQTLLRIIYDVLSNTQRKIIFVDGKGDLELALLLQALLRTKWQNIPIFRVGESGGVVGMPYNPFSGNKLAIVNRLVELLGATTGKSSAEVEYYNGIVRYFMQLACFSPSGIPKDLDQLEQWLYLDNLRKLWPKNSPDAKRMAHLDKEKLVGVLARLSPIVMELRPYLKADGFALEKVDGAIFSIDTQSYGDTSKRLMRLLIEDIKNYTTDRKPSQEQALIVVDEFGTLSSENITSLLFTARSRKVGVILATQNTASLGDETTQEQILTTINTHILHRTSSSERLSNLAGTEYQPEASIQIDKGAQTGMGSVRFQKAFRVHPDEVKGLGRGEAFLIRGDFASRLQVGRVQLNFEMPAASETPSSTPVVAEAQQPNIVQKERKTRPEP